MANKKEIKKRLEYLRGEIEKERISQGEIAELADLKDHIEPGDVLLLEWAGVPEFPKEFEKMRARADELYGIIERKTDPDTMSLINEYSDLQIEIEKDCNV